MRRLAVILLAASIGISTPIPAHACQPSISVLTAPLESRDAAIAAWLAEVLEHDADQIVLDEVAFLGTAASWRQTSPDERAEALALGWDHAPDKVGTIRTATSLKGNPPESVAIFYGAHGNMCIAGPSLLSGEEVLVSGRWRDGRFVGDVYTVNLPKLLEALERRGIRATPME